MDQKCCSFNLFVQSGKDLLSGGNRSAERAQVSLYNVF